MNIYEHTLETTRLVHLRLLEWVRELLIRAGMDSVQVKGRFSAEDAAGPTMTVFPYQMGAWPKMVETGSDIPMLGGPGDSEGIVPAGWKRAADLITQSMVEVFPVDRARGSRPARVRPIVPLSDLPTPLAEWYRAQGDSGSAQSWCVTGRRDTLSGRLPSMAWRRPLNVRHLYLVLANDTDEPSGLHAGMPFGLSALSVVLLGIQMERTLAVRVPAVPAGEPLLTFIDALAASMEGERAEQLAEMSEAVRSEFHTNIALLPFPDLPSDDSAEVMKALEKTLQPVVHLGVQIGIGGGPIFDPSVSPVFYTATTDDEDEDATPAESRRRRG